MMYCPKHPYEKMTLLFMHYVCDECDPPKVGASKTAVVIGQTKGGFRVGDKIVLLYGGQCCPTRQPGVITGIVTDKGGYSSQSPGYDIKWTCCPDGNHTSTECSSSISKAF